MKLKLNLNNIRKRTEDDDDVVWINKVIDEKRNPEINGFKDVETWKDMNGVDLVGPTVGDQKRYEVEKKPILRSRLPLSALYYY